VKLAIAAAVMLAPVVAAAQHDHSQHESGARVIEPVQREESSTPVLEPVPSLRSSTGGSSATAAATPTETKPWSVSASYNNAVGSAVFVANDAIRSSAAMWANTLSLRGGYRVHELLSLSADTSFAWEWTTPDSDTGRAWSFADIKVGAASPKLYTEEITGITLSARAALTLPTSIESFTSSNLTNASLGLGLSRTFGPVSFNYGFGFTKNFHLRQANVRVEEPTTTGNVNVSDPYLARHNFTVAQQAKLCFRRDGDAFCEVAGMNSNFSLSNSLSASWTIVEGLSLSLSYALVNRWSYSPPVDEFSSTVTDSSGARVVDGSGRSGDATSGGLDLSYAIPEIPGLDGVSFAVSFGFATMGPALTADGKSLRFPFYDFVSPANNLTSWYLDLSASL
jgi:hypothetical protein